MKVEVIKGVSHSIELNFGETSVCITPDEAQNLITQLRAVVPVPADIREAEIKKINITPNEVRYIVDAIPGANGIFRTEEDAKRGLAIFKAGIGWERARKMRRGDEDLEAAIDDFEDWDGSYSRADIPTSYTTRDIARFFANWERERLMKEAPVVDVIEMIGSTDAEYPFVLTLGFPRIPNIEYHGGKVRAIIEEIK